jgi:hypothetical protein
MATVGGLEVSMARQDMYISLLRLIGLWLHLSLLT